MNTAYLGDGPSRHGSPIKFLVAAIAMAFLPLGAMAQTPPATPPTDTTAPALDVDTSIPGLEEPVPAPPVAAAPLTTAAEPTETAEAHNPFSIQGMWAAGDIVSRTTLIIMIIMFAGTIYIAATKVVDQTILMGQVKRIGGFWEANSLDEGLDALGNKSAFRSVAEGAIAQANSSQAGLGARISRSDRMSHQVGIERQGAQAIVAHDFVHCPFEPLPGLGHGRLLRVVADHRRGASPHPGRHVQDPARIRSGGKRRRARNRRPNSSSARGLAEGLHPADQGAEIAME